MDDLMNRFGIPQEVMDYVTDGTLRVLIEDDGTKTVTFGVPAVDYTNERGHDFSAELTWIHPDFNAEHCHYFEEVPGDLPNFYLSLVSYDLGDESIDCEDIDELICWLQDARERVVRA